MPRRRRDLLDVVPALCQRDLQDECLVPFQPGPAAADVRPGRRLVDQPVGLQPAHQPVAGADGGWQRVVELGQQVQDDPHALGDRPARDLRRGRVDGQQAARETLDVPDWAVPAGTCGTGTCGTGTCGTGTRGAATGGNCSVMGRARVSRELPARRLGDPGKLDLPRAVGEPRDRVVEQLHLGVGHLPPLVEHLDLPGEQRGHPRPQVPRPPRLVEERQGEAVLAVADSDDQHLPPASPQRAPLGAGDPRLDGDRLTDGEVTEIGQFPPLLVAPWQMGEQVTDRLQLQGAGERRGGPRTHHVPQPCLLVDHTNDPARRHRQLRSAPRVRPAHALSWALLAGVSRAGGVRWRRGVR